MQNGLTFVWLKLLNVELSDDPAIPLLGVYPKELKARTQKWTHIHSIIIHYGQKEEKAQMFISG